MQQRRLCRCGWERDLCVWSCTDVSARVLGALTNLVLPRMPGCGVGARPAALGSSAKRCSPDRTTGCCSRWRDRNPGPGTGTERFSPVAFVAARCPVQDDTTQNIVRIVSAALARASRQVPRDLAACAGSGGRR